MPDAQGSPSPPHCPVNGLNCHGMAQYKCHVNSRAFSSRCLGSESLESWGWQGSLSGPSCATPLVLCDAPSGIPCQSPLLPWHWGIALLPSLMHLPKHLLALSTCIKLNRLFATFCLPVAGPLQNTEAHQTISLVATNLLSDDGTHQSYQKDAELIHVLLKCN